MSSLEAGGLIGSVHVILSIYLFADAVVLGLRWAMIVAVMEHDLSMAETPALQTKESKNLRVNLMGGGGHGRVWLQKNLIPTGTSVPFPPLIWEKEKQWDLKRLLPTVNE